MGIERLEAADIARGGSYIRCGNWFFYMPPRREN